MRYAYEWFKVESWWLVHNVVAHPIVGVLNLVGRVVEFASDDAAKLVFLAGDWVHDVTMPTGAMPRNTDVG